jgi:hypothetical protein
VYDRFGGVRVSLTASKIHPSEAEVIAHTWIEEEGGYPLSLYAETWRCSTCGVGGPILYDFDMREDDE